MIPTNKKQLDVQAAKELSIAEEKNKRRHFDKYNKLDYWKRKFLFNVLKIMFILA